MKLSILVLSLTFLLLLSQAKGQAQDCDCDYHPGGCTISSAPPEGRFKSFELTHQITDLTPQVGNVSVNTRGFGLVRGGLNSATRMRTALQTAFPWTAAVTVEGIVEDTRIHHRHNSWHFLKWTFIIV